MTDLPPPAPAPATGFDFNRPTIVALLYLSSFILGITGLIGLVLAYVWRSEPHDAWEESHYAYLIRTFWLGLLASFVCLILSLVLIGLFGFLVVFVWFVVRTVLSLVAAQKREPLRDPQTLLW